MHALKDCLHSSEIWLVVKLPSDVYESLGTSGGIISSTLSNIIQLKMLETGREMSTHLSPSTGVGLQSRKTWTPSVIYNRREFWPW